MMNTKQTILDIAMNLTRMGNWTADGFSQKQPRIRVFLDQTTRYIEKVSQTTFSPVFKQTFQFFLREYAVMKHELLNHPRDEQKLAEKLMTWGNILTHRAKLIKSA